MVPGFGPLSGDETLRPPAGAPGTVLPPRRLPLLPSTSYCLLVQSSLPVSGGALPYTPRSPVPCRYHGTGSGYTSLWSSAPASGPVEGKPPGSKSHGSSRFVFSSPPQSPGGPTHRASSHSPSRRNTWAEAAHILL